MSLGVYNADNPIPSNTCIYLDHHAPYLVLFSPTMERACDSCAKIKYKCSRIDVSSGCERCARLEIRCTSNRVPSRRGRPPKRRRTASVPDEHDIGNNVSQAVQDDGVTSYVSPAANSASGHRLLDEPSPATTEHFHNRSASLQSADLPLGDVITLQGLGEQLRELALDQHVAFALLEELWLKKGDMFPLLALQYAGPHVADFLEMGYCSVALTFAMLTCAIIMSRRPDISERRYLLAENCRIYALSHIPILTWKSENMESGDAYALAILSSLGYLEKDTCDISARWARLSAVIMEDCAHNKYDVHGHQSDPQRYYYYSTLS
jgi:hypothetical protein